MGDLQARETRALIQALCVLRPSGTVHTMGEIVEVLYDGQPTEGREQIASIQLGGDPLTPEEVTAQREIHQRCEWDWVRRALGEGSLQFGPDGVRFRRGE